MNHGFCLKSDYCEWKCAGCSESLNKNDSCRHQTVGAFMPTCSSHKRVTDSQKGELSKNKSLVKLFSEPGGEKVGK